LPVINIERNTIGAQRYGLKDAASTGTSLYGRRPSIIVTPLLKKIIWSEMIISYPVLI
jgi:hypothetical protein